MMKGLKGYLIPDWPAASHIRACSLLRPCDHNLLLPSEPVWLKQVHSGEVLPAEKARNQSVDGSYTRENNIICVVSTADCLPVLITNTTGSVVAAVHAGWKGLAKNILRNTVEKLNSDPQDLLIWLGPAISSQNYEVGQDMKDYFPEYTQAFEAIKNKSNKYWANLYELAKLKLAELNINPKNIYTSNYCTYSNPDLLHSARRDKEKRGGVVSMIWKEA